MSNFERPSLQGWDPLQLNREQEQQHPESDQDWNPDEDSVASIQDIVLPNEYKSPKSRGGGNVLGKTSHWNYCPKHGTFLGDECDELPPHD